MGYYTKREINVCVLEKYMQAPKYALPLICFLWAIFWVGILWLLIIPSKFFIVPYLKTISPKPLRDFIFIVIMVICVVISGIFSFLLTMKLGGKEEDGRKKI
jgi:hypothetical protein